MVISSNDVSKQISSMLLNLTAQRQCVCGGSEFAINILKKIGLFLEKSRADPKLESKVNIIVI